MEASYDFFMALPLPPEEQKSLDTRKGAKEIDQAIYSRMKSDPSLRWSIANGLFTFHAKSPSDWFKMTRLYTMKDVAEKITCPC